MVQGVGFRPFIYRLAKKHNLNGNIVNRSDGVLVTVFGDQEKIDSFQWDIIKHAPTASLIKNIIVNKIDNFWPSSFDILPSEIIENQITEISPDITICADCLSDLKKQPHRINYPFINCTHCGPRFSIIKDLPYDRINTTMHEYEMCLVCSHEYNDVEDRRFHAQPVACNNCGPSYKIGKEYDFNKIIRIIVDSISGGKVLAIKGLGGYNLICDAQNSAAVLRIREIKERDGKPFAVMFKDIENIRQYCHVSENEENILESWQRPVVLLNQKLQLCSSINNGLNTMGAVLPYLPFHYMLFEQLNCCAIVYTSANFSGEPIISDDFFAVKNLSFKVDAFISHNRKIENPIDDSVVQVVSEKQQLIRRARGYVPSPVELDLNAEGIFAVGAELKNCFCIGKNNSAILSQHIGDLKNYETFEFYKKNVDKFFTLFKFTPKVIACDLHPDYLSTQFAESLAQNDKYGKCLQVIKVQHHHAHIVSCMAEYKLKNQVIGVSFDGTGYGKDDNIWGGEFLICDRKSFSRYAHFNYVKMPGGDLAVDQPWRMTLAYLNNTGHKIEEIECFKSISNDEILLIQRMIHQDINSPLTSGAGRLFDVVACLLNLGTVQSFDAEGPMRLEAIADKNETGKYPFDLKNDIILFDKTLDSIIEDLRNIPVSAISAKFHNTIVQSIRDVAVKIRKEVGLNNVVLSGGVFQNRFLLEKSLQILKENKFETFTNYSVPPNDGGIALGQLVVASNFM